MADAIGAAEGFAAETGGQQMMPFQRSVLWITLIFFLILALVGVIESFQQHSIYPLLDRTVLKVVAADHQLARQVESVVTHQTPAFTGLFQKSFPSYLWFWLKFYLNMIGNLYFIFFFIMLLYWGFRMLNQTSALKNILLAALTYLIITTLAGTLLYVADMNGRTMPVGRDTAIKHWWMSSYPLEGVSKTVMYYVAPSTLKSIADWTETSAIAPIITNVPQGTIAVNATPNATTNVTPTGGGY